MEGHPEIYSVAKNRTANEKYEAMIVTPWFGWLAALPRFELLVSHARLLVANAITPYAALVYWRQTGTWALLLAPAAAAWVWFTFRRGADMADRILALFGGAFLISPYAMNYELALFAPATAIYLARTSDRRWPGYVAAALGQVQRDALNHGEHSPLAVPARRGWRGPPRGADGAG